MAGGSRADFYIPEETGRPARRIIANSIASGGFFALNWRPPRTINA
jgi:hypothetical protein